MISDKVYIPPFKTQGIKSKLVPLIRDSVSIGDETTWIEPFMGSGVVGLNIARHNAIFADINPHIINFYNALKTQEITSAIVREYLTEQGEHLSKKDDEHYYFVRNRFNREHNPLDFLFLNRACFNGMIRFNKSNGYNVPYGHKPERFAKAYITKIVNQVKYFEQKLAFNDWTFLCQGFEETIAMADFRSFVYCDPPYIGRHVDYYDSWDEKQEQQLKKSLLLSGANFMLSTWEANKYRSNPYVETIWSGYHKTTQEHFYFVGAKEENRNAMTEALLTNYQVHNRGASSEPHSEYVQLQLSFS
jgi:DNA adenine methylase